MYSRISSQILGDWNACGKVMGLAAWADKKKSAAKEWIFSNQNINELSLGDDFYHKVNMMSGKGCVCLIVFILCLSAFGFENSIE